MSRMLTQSAAISFAMLLAVALWAPTVSPVATSQLSTVTSLVLA
ncbi:hypothetical protein [Croceicoccus naphthovorans]|nr:hypothetical protein [Croceicoccus naphthovorans]MBB3989573.1 hypothetical protein [Croceicoccus naphthovorans]